MVFPQGPDDERLWAHPRVNEQLPAPDFDRSQYERPNQDWVCGWTCDGRACRIGPSPTGGCRATFDCRPVLEKKAGEEKGRWRCTRSKEHGGPCENGPGPAGVCACAVPKCQPQPSLRKQRGRLCFAVSAATLAILLIGFGSSWRWRFISPGDVSSSHHGGVFAANQPAHPASEGCAACHVAAQGDLRDWLHAAFSAQPGPLEPHRLHQVSVGAMTRIDESCLACHPGHKFHQPNVVRDHSCSACHLEHQGQGRMAAPADGQCLSCHGNASVMQASLVKGRENLPRPTPNVERSKLSVGRSTLMRMETPRPVAGYTSVFQSFAQDHPEFQIHQQKLRETNTLRFNHQLHLADNFTQLNGQKLTCADCHQPESAGAYFQPLTFTQHCASCHALQFDAQNPELHLPHGDPAGVRAFLRSLPTQYADLARRRGTTRQPDVDRFVQTQMRHLRELAFTGENLEQQVFLAGNAAQPLATAAGPATTGRTRFPGCAYCHEVKSAGEAVPQVTRPIIPDRWLTRGAFHHAKHLNVSCTQCHAMHGSRDTADIVLPTKQSCTECHSPAGGASESCSTCHSYHPTHRH